MTQHTVWIKNRTSPKTNKYLLQRSLCFNTYPSFYCTLQALRSTRSMIQLHCQKPPLWQVTLLPYGYETRALTLSEICWNFFSSLFIFSQVRATQKCVNDSPGVTVFLCKITKVFSLSRPDTNLPAISYQAISPGLQWPLPAVSFIQTQFRQKFPWWKRFTMLAALFRPWLKPTEPRSPPHFIVIQRAHWWQLLVTIQPGMCY